MSDNGSALFLAGPPGAGKTTLARSICRRLQRLESGIAMHIELDNIRHIVLDEAEQPGSTSGIWLELAVALGVRAQEVARWIVVEGLFYSPEELALLSNVFPSAVLVELDISLEICLERNCRRDDRREILENEEVKRLWGHRRVGPWNKIDATDPIEMLTDRLAVLMGGWG